MKILPCLGIFATAGGLIIGSGSAKAVKPQIPEKQDVFERTIIVPPEGTSNDSVLLFAPDPEIFIMGERKTAAIVVDLSKNILYKYNELGAPEKAYLIASGKKNTPTDPGVRIVSHVEKYPYKTAPASTKRRRQPWNYGPNAIILNKLDTETGKQSQTGEFIHGNNNPASIGKYASLGCMRMDNEVIKELSKQVKRGDIVIITRE